MRGAQATTSGMLSCQPSRKPLDSQPLSQSKLRIARGGPRHPTGQSTHQLLDSFFRQPHRQPAALGASSSRPTCRRTSHEQSTPTSARATLEGDPRPPGFGARWVVRGVGLMDAGNGSLGAMFDHVGIAVSDLAMSERFYRTVLTVLGVEPSHADAELVEWEDWGSARRTASTL